MANTVNDLAKAARERCYARWLQITCSEVGWSVLAIPEVHIAQTMVKRRYPRVPMHLSELYELTAKEISGNSIGTTIEQALERLQPNADVLAAVEEIKALSVKS